jgi:hypothetical protein
LQSLLLPPKIYEITFVICENGKTRGLRIRHEKGKRNVFTFLHHENVKKRNGGWR